MVRTDKRIGRQIFKLYGNNCFVEALNDYFHKEKLHLNFSTFDGTQNSGEKIKDRIDFYMSFNDALTFCDLVISGKFTEMLNKHRAAYRKALLQAEAQGKAYNQCGYIYNKSFWTLTRGTDKNLLKEKRADGKSESRRLKLFPGLVPPERMAHPEDPKWKNKKKPNRFMLQCESGPGDKIESKIDGGYIIQPAYGNKPEKRIMIPFSDFDDYNYMDSFFAFAKAIQTHIESYIQASYSYEFANPTPNIIRLEAVHEVIHVGEEVDIVMYTPSNVTEIKAFIKDDVEIKPDIPMVSKPTGVGTLEWHFIKKANKVSKTYFSFLPYANYEQSEFKKGCLITVVEK